MADTTETALLALIIRRECVDGTSDGAVAIVTERLIIAESQLRLFAEMECNTGLSEHHGSQREKVEIWAEQTAEQIGLTIETNRDPRGSAVRIMTPRTGAYNTMGGAEHGWSV